MGILLVLYALNVEVDAPTIIFVLAWLRFILKHTLFSGGND